MNWLGQAVIAVGIVGVVAGPSSWRPFFVGWLVGCAIAWFYELNRAKR